MDAETRATIQALRQMGNTLGAKAMGCYGIHNVKSTGTSKERMPSG